MRIIVCSFSVLVAGGCGAGLDGPNDDEIATTEEPLAVYNAGPDTCTGWGVNSFVPGVYDCRPSGTVPITQFTCPAAQWLWTGAPGGYSSSTGNEKGNAYCVEYPYTGAVDYGQTFTGPHMAVVEEIGGLWVPSINGCNKNIRVCLGSPTQPAAGATVVGCGTTGSAGCAVCATGSFRPGEVTSATSTCCSAGLCLRNTLSVAMGNAGVVTSDFGTIDCTSGACDEDFSDLAHVTLARGDSHVDWTGWDGDCTGLQDSCAVTMDDDRSVGATYHLGGVVSGAISPFGLRAHLDRDSSQIATLPIGLFVVELAGTNYSFSQDGVCTLFAHVANTFACGRLRAGSGTVTVTHVASGATRLFDVSFGRR